MITDLTYLKTMSDNDPAFIGEMIDIFQEQIGEFIREMPVLLDNREFTKLSRLAHKAKASVAVMGMSHEADLLKELEVNALEGREEETYAMIIRQFINSSREALIELDIYKKNNTNHDRI